MSDIDCIGGCTLFNGSADRLMTAGDARCTAYRIFWCESCSFQCLYVQWMAPMMKQCWWVEMLLPVYWHL